MRVKDMKPGTLFFTAEKIGDDKNMVEVREVLYVREPDRPCRYEHNVSVARLATVQGIVLDKPRYVVRNDPPCRDPGEMDGRTLANLFPGISLWADHLQKA